MAKKQSGGNDNTCHLFAELDPGQPASAIVNFVTKVMIGLYDLYGHALAQEPCPGVMKFTILVPDLFLVITTLLSLCLIYS